MENYNPYKPKQTRYYCEVCQVYVMERMRNRHNKSEIHISKKQKQMSRQGKVSSKERNKRISIQRQLNEMEDAARKSMRGMGDGKMVVKGEYKNGSAGPIGPSLPNSYFEDKKKKEIKKLQSEKRENLDYNNKDFNELYQKFYAHFLEQEKERLRQEKLQKTGIEIQAKLDAEKHIQQMIESGNFLQMMNQFSQKKVEQPVPKTEVIENDENILENDKYKDMLEEQQYYNNPDYFFTEESKIESERLEKIENQKKKKKEIVEKRKKVRDKKLRKKMREEQIKMEKKKYYSQFEIKKRENIDEDTGMGMWEDIDGDSSDSDEIPLKKEEEKSILGKRKNNTTIKIEPGTKILKKEKTQPSVLFSVVEYSGEGNIKKYEKKKNVFGE